jgi:hypothetical protein
MKIRITLVFIAGLLCSIGQAATETSKQTIAVLDFQANNASAGDAAFVSEFVRSAVVKAGVYNVVDKKNMEKILAEQAFQQSGCTSEECAVKLGKILNVNKMVVGIYGNFEGTRILTARLVDVETGKIEKSETAKGFTPTDVDRASEDLVARLFGGTPYEQRAVVETNNLNVSDQKSPFFSFAKSLVFPGWGQYSTGHYVRGGLYTLAAATSLALFFTDREKTTIYRYTDYDSSGRMMSDTDCQTYEEAVQKAQANMQAGIAARYSITPRNYYDNKIEYLFILGGVALISSIDAAISANQYNDTQRTKATSAIDLKFIPSLDWPRIVICCKF